MDMLRYDKAYPLTEEDSVNISGTFYRSANFEINVGTSQSNFSVDRWRSFGVSVTQFKDIRSLMNGKR